MSEDPSSQRGFVQAVEAKAQAVIQEDYAKAKQFAVEAAQSKSYLYPVKGIYYFARHRSLWKPVLSLLLPYLALSATVTTGMFIFTYAPQLAIQVFVNGPLAVGSTIILVLQESAIIINMISRMWLLKQALIDVFDATLVAHNAHVLVSKGRELKPGSNPMEKLGKIRKSTLEERVVPAVVRYFMYLPLNYIPVVGTVVFLFLHAQSRGKLIHHRYFSLKGWSSAQSSGWLQARKSSYAAFGLVATIIEMIPFVSVFFTFTNTVGAALWAADLEAADATASAKQS